MDAVYHMGSEAQRGCQSNIKDYRGFSALVYHVFGVIFTEIDFAGWRAVIGGIELKTKLYQFGLIHYLVRLDLMRESHVTTRVRSKSLVCPLRLSSPCSSIASGGPTLFSTLMRCLVVA